MSVERTATAVMGYAEFPRMMEAAAHQHCVSLYAYTLHILQLHQWSAKRVAHRMGATLDSVIRVMRRCGIRMMHLPRYQLAHYAVAAGYSNPADYAVALIQQHGSLRAAARSLGVSTNAVAYPLEVADLCGDVRPHLRLHGSSALYLPRQLCAMYGISYTALQDAWNASVERAHGVQFQTWSAAYFCKHGLRCEAVSILGWPRKVVAAAVYAGCERYSKKRAERMTKRG